MTKFSELASCSKGTYVTSNGVGEQGCSDQPGGGLVDDNLNAEQAKAVVRTKLALIQPEGRRMMSVFLGNGDYEKIQDEMSTVMADLLLGCLREFVHRNDGKIVWAMRAAFHDQVVNAIQHIVEVNGTVWHILRDGYLYLQFPDERVVISAVPDEDKSDICVRSNADPVAFFTRWRHYAMKHNHLSGHP